MAKNSNPFKLEDHYDESFLLEDDGDDDSINSLSEDLPHENKKLARPPSARHGRSRSAHSTNSNRDAGYYGSYEDQKQQNNHHTGGASNVRPVSGKFRNPAPPQGPKREKSGTIRRKNRANNDDTIRDVDELEEADSYEEHTKQMRNDRFVDSEEESSEEESELESTDDEFARPSGPAPPKDNPRRAQRQRQPETNQTQNHKNDLLDSNSELDTNSIEGLDTHGNYRVKNPKTGGYQEENYDKNQHNLVNDSDSEDDGTNYNPADFKNLNVDDEVRDLFRYISVYKPVTESLNPRLKPFIPEFIPAVGDIDAFLKVPRPDGQDDKFGLGWLRLDEPTLKQTDPAVLDQFLKI